MANSLFQMMQPQVPMANGFAQFAAQFNQFRQTFQGDPKAKVQQLLNSGQMSQQQFNQLAVQAQQLARMMGM